MWNPVGPVSNVYALYLDLRTTTTRSPLPNLFGQLHCLLDEVSHPPHRPLSHDRSLRYSFGTRRAAPASAARRVGGPRAARFPLHRRRVGSTLESSQPVRIVLRPRG